MANRLCDMFNSHICAANTHFVIFEQIVHSPLSDERGCVLWLCFFFCCRFMFLWHEDHH